MLRLNLVSLPPIIPLLLIRWPSMFVYLLILLSLKYSLILLSLKYSKIVFYDVALVVQAHLLLRQWLALET